MQSQSHLASLNKFVRLFKVILASKQTPIVCCNPLGCWCLRVQVTVCVKETCKVETPYEPQYSRRPVLDTSGKRWRYFRPGEEHRNVVPYHPQLLLIWGADMNLQKVTGNNWSYYVLKYSIEMRYLSLDPKLLRRGIRFLETLHELHEPLAMNYCFLRFCMGNEGKRYP